MAGYIDLHLHTIYSDGKKTPAELLAYARQAQLDAIAITDHDTLEGYNEARTLLTPDDPELISGIELSALTEDRDLHILAYLIDSDNHEFNVAVEQFRKRRIDRGRQIVEKLNDLGLAVTFEAVQVAAGDGVIGRPHIAEAMAACGAVASYEEAFRKYIHNGGPAYIPKARMTPVEAIRLTHAAGGLAILAHPFLDDMIRLLPELVDMGLDGIEAFHYTHSLSEIKRAHELARQYKLAVTGGSDFHGRDNGRATVGAQKVPVSILDELKERAYRRNN